ncbi:MAG: glycoside hydrolase N-terminal domain-containing protein [Cyclobacteriaceae bacterium]
MGKLLVFISLIMITSSAESFIDADSLVLGMTKEKASKIAPKRGTYSTNPARKYIKGDTWEDGFVTGNGKMGALILGNPEHESIWLNHAQCFRPLGSDETVPDLSRYHSSIRETAKEQGSKAANEVILKWAKENNWELKWTDPFRPALNLELWTSGKGQKYDYIRTEDFSSGELKVGWSDDLGSWVRKLFVSRKDDVVVISLKGPKKGALSCKIPIAKIPDNKLDFSSIKGRKTTEFADFDTPAKSIESNIDVAFSGTNSAGVIWENTYAQGKGGYNIAMQVITDGGKLGKEDDKLIVENSDEVLILVRIQPWTTDNENNVSMLRSALKELPEKYSELFSRHYPLHNEMFERARLKLYRPKTPLVSSGNELVENAVKQGYPDLEFVERLYDASRYMLICAGSEYNPPNLQGIWSGLWETPFFSGDYTMDANVQCAIGSAFSANLPEQMEGVFSLLDRHMDDFKLNAQKYYGCDGIMLPSRISNTGVMIHWNENYPGHLWHSGAAWFGHYFIEHWNYFGDREFLEKRTVPYLKEVAAFYEDFLWEDENGKLCISPAYSAEMRTSGQHALGSNPTQDIAAIREILNNLIRFCRMLNTDHDKIPLWQTMLSKLPDYGINPDGVLKEYADPTNPLVEEKHSHCSPLYPMFVTGEFSQEETPELWAAGMKALEVRCNNITATSGFGISQRTATAAFLERSDIVWDMFCMLVKNRMVYPSMMTSHNSQHHVFNVDAGGMFPELVNNTLVKSSPQKLDLLPAVVEAWTQGEVRGILARQQLKIDLLQWDLEGRNLRLDVVSGKVQQVKLRIRRENGIKTCKVKKGGARVTDGAKLDEKIVELPANELVRLDITF